MVSLFKINPEVIQLFIPTQAWEYFLVPFKKEAKLFCYGEKERAYREIIAEAEVVTGFPIEIEEIEKNDLMKLLNHYYKKSSTVTFTAGKNFIHELVTEAFKSYASDIHFEPSEQKSRIRFRIDGKLVEKYILDKLQYASYVNQIKILANLDISEKRLPQDGRIMYKGDDHKFDIRVSSLPAIYGEKIVMRLLTRHTELLEIGNLGFTQRQMEDYLFAANKPHGLILISGPTGSGKSTTLYATLRLLNRETNNILTIEDPVEYTLDGINQVQLKEDIGLTFSSALRTFLRQDPDIIMLGEIRDPDTAHMAIRSSLTGHLILSTIHTNSAYGSVYRLTDMGIHPYLISNTLILCVSQRLVRILCSNCKTKEEKNGQILYKPTGCEECSYTGYKGRKAIYEVIPVDREISECIKNSVADIGNVLKKKGITTLEESALQLLIKGETTREEILPLLQS